jgi:hypothetical protein
MTSPNPLTGPREADNQYGDQPTPTYLDLPIAASTLIYPGAIVCLSGGYVVNATTATGLVCIGICDGLTLKPGFTADNSTGSNGAFLVRVHPGVFDLQYGTAGDAITQANVGQLAYLIDNQTVSPSSAGGTRSPAGLIVGFNTPIYVASGPTARVVLGGVFAQLPSTSILVQSGTGTLSSGVLTVNTGITVSAQSVVIATRNTPGGTLSTNGLDAPSASRVVGGPGTGTIVINAILDNGTTQTLDTSTVDYLIVG